MSLSSLYNDVSRIERDIAGVHKKLADETQREINKQKQIDSVQRSINSSTSISTVQSKMNQIKNYQSELLNIRKRISDLYKKQSELSNTLNRKKQDVLKEEKREREKVNREQEDFQKKLQQELDEQRFQLKKRTSWLDKYNIKQTSEIETVKEYDFFISHASEDKDFATPLCSKLQDAGKTVWLDSLEMTIGDSLRTKIDEGLKRSRFGVVILSQFYFKKFWTNQELSGLVAKEVNGHKIILPIWHKVTRDDVLNYSPTLADKFELNSSVHSLDDIVQALLNEVKV